MRTAATLALLVLLASACARATVMDTELAGTLPNVGLTMSLHADATQDPLSNIWIYTYVATIVNSSMPVTGFSVGNMNRQVFFDATNDKNMTDPVFSGTDSIIWHSGYVLNTDGPVTFSFQSYQAPTIVDVSLFGSARTAVGKSLGMVPEPGTMAGVGIMALGGLGAFYRRRRARR